MNQYLSRSILFLLLTTEGCVTANFTQPISSFQSSVTASASVIGNYYTEMNLFERQVYLDSVANRENEIIEAKDANGNPTPLYGAVFDGQSIKARLDAINLIGVYAKRLGDLASSTAPADFSKSTSALGKNLTSLSDTFITIANTPNSQDKTATSYIGPISDLVGSIGKMYLQQKQDQAVKEAIDNGAPAVTKILTLLENDLTTIIEPLQITGIKGELADRVKGYNDRVRASLANTNPVPFPIQDRQSAIADINSVLSRYDAVIASNPANLVETMQASVNALVKYANSNKTPTDFASLVAQLQAFESNVSEIATSVETIRDLRKGTK